MMRNHEYTYKFMEEFAEQILCATDIRDPENVNPDNPIHEMLYLSDFLDKICEEGHISYKAYEAGAKAHVDAVNSL